MATRKDLQEHALHAFLAGDLPRALRVYAFLVEKAPTDYEARIKVADVLAAAGFKAEAIAGYRAVARFDVKSGHPLPGVVAARALAALGEPVDDVWNAVAKIYGRGSSFLDPRAPRLAPADLDEELGVPPISDLQPGARVDPASAQAAARLLADEKVLDELPDTFKPLPLLSELDEKHIRTVIEAMTVQRLVDKQVVIHEGEIGRSFFLVAAGSVVVYNVDSLGHRVDLAELHEGAVFGEMALLSASPRTASVEVDGEADLLELGRDALAALAGQLEAVATALDAFTRERLLRNVIGTSKLFRLFSRQQQQELLRRFTQHDCAPGTVLIREGDEGRGLYVVLSGELEVVKKEGMVELDLATLKPGEVAGEIALVRGGPTTATVRAARPSTVLFLDRIYVQRLLDALPELRQMFEQISEARMSETAAAMGGADGIEPVADEDILLF